MNRRQAIAAFLSPFALPGEQENLKHLPVIKFNNFLEEFNPKGSIANTLELVKNRKFETVTDRRQRCKVRAWLLEKDRIILDGEWDFVNYADKLGIDATCGGFLIYWGEVEFSLYLDDGGFYTEIEPCKDSYVFVGKGRDFRSVPEFPKEFDDVIDRIEKYGRI